MISYKGTVGIHIMYLTKPSVDSLALLYYNRIFLSFI